MRGLSNVELLARPMSTRKYVIKWWQTFGAPREVATHYKQTMFALSFGMRSICDMFERSCANLLLEI